MDNIQRNRCLPGQCKIQLLTKLWTVLLPGLLVNLFVYNSSLADFAVQVGVFQSITHLERAKLKLKKSGFQVITQTITRKKTESNPLIRIMIGPFQYREQARRTSRELNTLGWKHNFIRSISKTTSLSTHTEPTATTDDPDKTSDKTAFNNSVERSDENVAESSSGPEIKWFGFAGIELRAFQKSAQYASQHNRSSLSFVLQPELYLRWAERRESLTFTPFIRVDEHDDDRTHYDIRELMWEKSASNWEIRVGIGKVFWGVTESQHLVDIINQTDFVENPDGEEKLGQPMVNFAWIQDWGTIDFFVLPGFRERTFPGVEGRIRTQPRVDNDQREYQSSRGKKHVDYAVRWSHSLGDWDMGLSYFYGTNRDPRFIAGTDHAAQVVFIPYYDLIHQTGIDIQATKGNWLWKLEAIRRTGELGGNFTASTSGLEYTFYGIMETATDLGIVTEYLYDSRNNAAPTPLQDDYMLGLRFNFNDVQSSEALLGVISDGGSQARALFLEASRRLGNSWRLGLEARIYQNFPVTDPIYTIRNDDYMQLDLNYYF